MNTFILETGIIVSGKAGIFAVVVLILALSLRRKDLARVAAKILKLFDK